jgi:mannan endo-1,4-beta-mannosidase
MIKIATYRFFIINILLFSITSVFAGDLNQISKQFVSVKGTQFYLNDKTYRYIGANYWQGAWIGADFVPQGKERLNRELDLLKQNGITNLRIMASSEESGLLLSVKPAFQIKPGIYNEKLFEGLDYLLDEMSKRGMKAVLVLNNYWQWSGGMAQYLNWSTGIPVNDPDGKSNYWEFMKMSGKFYEDSLAMSYFNDYIKYITERKNTINGVAYNEDPTIMTWELANEPRPYPVMDADASLILPYYQWIGTTSAYIHLLAPYQLVTTGNEGLKGSLEKDTYFLNSHNFKSVDYATFHIWPKNWRWYMATDPENTFGPTIEKTKEYLTDHIEMARKLNKPVILEEFGFERDNGNCAKNSPVTYRNKFYDIIFKLVCDSALAGSPIAGANFWTFGGEGTSLTDDYKWKEATDFTGDPPQEAQGLNSIYSSDTSTLNVIRKYAFRIH